MKYFIITVDTEGDNLWRYKEGEEIGVKNAEYIPRFQKLCEKYGFKPVYLTNFEMANSKVFVEEAKEWLAKGSCEIGVHLHAWNNPPLYDLKRTFHGNPYLIEYPDDVMKAKFKTIYDLIVENFGVKPVSHRAGRWAMDERYFHILKDFGIKVDCSYTPGVSWANTKGATIGGSDYSSETNQVSMVNDVMEVPASIRKFRSFQKGSTLHKLKTLLKGDNVWLRPATCSVSSMKTLLTKINRDENVDFAEFMLHSSELMPDGSPYFVTEKDIEQEFEAIENVFRYAHSLCFEGCTLAEYYQIKKH